MASIGEARDRYKASLAEMQQAAGEQAKLFGSASTQAERRNAAAQGLGEMVTALSGRLVEVMMGNERTSSSLRQIGDGLDPYPGRADIEPGNSKVLDNQDFRETRKNADWLSDVGKETRDNALAATSESSTRHNELEGLLRALRQGLAAVQAVENTPVDAGALQDAAGVAMVLENDAQAAAFTLDEM